MTVTFKDATGLRELNLMTGDLNIDIGIPFEMEHAFHHLTMSLSHLSCTMGPEASLSVRPSVTKPKTSGTRKKIHVYRTGLV